MTWIASARLAAVAVLLQGCVPEHDFVKHVGYDMASSKYEYTRSPEAGGSGDTTKAANVTKTRDLAHITTYTDAAEAAQFFADYYARKSNSLFESVQLFELPLIGGALAIAAGTAFGANGTFMKIAGMTTGAGGAYEAYLSPRTRAAIAADGVGAMLCLEELALNYDKVAPSNAQPVTVTGNAARDKKLSDDAKTAQPANARILANAIFAVNLAVTRRDRSQTGAPNLTAVIATAKTSARQQFEDAKTADGKTTNFPLNLPASAQECVARAGSP